MGQLVTVGTQNSRLGVRCKTLLCKETTTAKSKETKTGHIVAESSKEGYDKKKAFL
jgi:hypothetical protein